MSISAHSPEIRNLIARLNLLDLLQDMQAELPDRLQELLHGLALYQHSAQDPDFAFIAVNHDGPASDSEHQNFLSGFHGSNAVHLPGTVIGKSFFERSAAPYHYEQSGFRPDQFCYARSLPEPLSRFALQFIFKAEHFRDPLSEIDRHDLYQQISASYLMAELQMRLRMLMNSVEGDLFQIQNQPGFQPKMAFVMHCDISGHTRLAEKAGFPNIYGFNEMIREALIADIARPLGGRIIRAEGDGVWLNFPATKLNEDNALRYMKTHVVQVGYQIAQNFDRIAQDFRSDVFRAAKIRTGIVHGEIFLQRCSSAYQPYIFEGEAFTRLSRLVDDAPRTHSTVHLDRSALQASGLYPTALPEGQVLDAIELFPEVA